MTSIANLVHETSTTTGTGNFTLTSANGKQTFNTAFGTGGTDLFYYFISNQGAAEWEVGTGHMSDSTTLVRDTVLASSNSGSAVSFTAGTKDVTNALPATQQGRFPTDYISPSVILSNAADADHDLTVAAGTARSDDDTVDITLSSAITKAFDATWVVGTGNGGMQSGSALPTSGTVNIYMIRRSDTGVVDVMGVPQGTALSLPTNYDSSVHIASICTDSSANFLAFTCFRRAGKGYYLNYAGLIADIHTETQGTTPTARTLSVPVGRKIWAWIHIDYGSAYTRIYDPDQAEVTPAADSAVLTTETATGIDGDGGSDIWVWTNTSAQVNTDASSSNWFIKTKTYGYFDPLV